MGKTLLDVDNAFIDNATNDELGVLLNSTVELPKTGLLECFKRLEETESIIKDWAKVNNYDFGKEGIKATAKHIKGIYTALNAELVRFAAILEITKQDTQKRIAQSGFMQDYEQYGAAIFPDENKPNN